ncbi:MAG TPA: endonuclease III [Blastocatellia bacterium]
MERQRDGATGRRGDGARGREGDRISLSPRRPVAPSPRLSPSPSELREKRRLVKYITQNLEAAYGVPVNVSPYDPLSELILTILSQSTTDINSRRAFENLKQRFPDWESARRARASSIAAAIKSGGLANAKSMVIKNALNEIKKRRGSLDLSFLHTSPIEEAREFLTSLTGVGPKTAACVLLFACNRKIFPMDVHILRITKRIGLVYERFSDEQSHKRMEKLVPPNKHYSLHVNLIRHGRQICRPQNPKCDKCPLVEQCDYGQSQL